MKVSQIIPAGSPDAADPDRGPARHRNLVIENLAELAAAGVPALCGSCWADCAAPAFSGHHERRSTPWTMQTAR
jgi:hypothetical protein